jgi:hypothetical protein
MLVCRPEFSLWPDGSTSAGNYGWLFVVADVSSGLNPTPPQETKKRTKKQYYKRQGSNPGCNADWSSLECCSEEFTLSQLIPDIYLNITNAINKTSSRTPLSRNADASCYLEVTPKAGVAFHHESSQVRCGTFTAVLQHLRLSTPV